MNNLIKHKNRISLYLLAGYLLLVAYSSFHYHKIGFNNPSEYEQPNNTSSDTYSGDQVIYALSTCQFNLIYNSPSVIEPISNFGFKLNIPSERFGIVEKETSYPYLVFSLSPLRAPPYNS